MIQGSEEWLLARCGMATASEFSSVLAKGQGKTRATYMRRVIAERLTGKPHDGYRNGHMDRGVEQEPMARMAYEAASDCFVEQIGFIKHATLMAGCSPDGLIGTKGGAEIKCVLPHIHVETMLSGSYPSEHRAQIQGSLWLTEREWWDFCSYCPDMPPHLRLYVYRVQRDEAYIKTIEEEVRRFLAEVDEVIARLSAPALKVAA
jgi:hypothetical protein